MNKRLLKNQEKEMIEIYEKLSPPKREEVFNFVKWIWKERPKKTGSLAGALGNIEINEEEIEAAKKSLFPYEK